MSDASWSRPNRRWVALGLALLVTFLWSTSWVLIKLGLDELELPPLSFAGLRYLLAALVLLPLAAPALLRARPWQAPSRVLGPVLLLGVLLYAVTQGAQFAALVHLPAVAVGLVLSTTPVLIAAFSLRAGERPSRLQLVGVALLVIGAALYFGPFELGDAGLLGLAIALVGLTANAGAALLGRRLAHDELEQLGGVIGLTASSMLAGALVLVGVGLAVEGLPTLALDAWLIIGWLALVNTALAFSLWNQTLRTLTAVESSVMNNLMLVQIAILAWVFLGEALGVLEMTGLGLALAGILLVQLAPVLLRRRTTRLASVPLAAPGGTEAALADAAESGERH